MRGRSDTNNRSSLRNHTWFAPFHTWRRDLLTQPIGTWQKRSEVPEPQGYTVFDTETTGFGPKAQIIQLAMIRTDKDGNIQDTFSTLIRPEVEISDQAAEVHGITADMVADKPTFGEFKDTISDFLTGYVWSGHNLKFDADMIANEYKRLDQQMMPWWGSACTMQFARAAHPTLPNSLEDCLKRLGHTPDPTRLHDAMYDTEGTLTLLQSLLKRDIAPESLSYVERNWYRQKAIGQTDAPTDKATSFVTNRLKSHFPKDWNINDYLVTLQNLTGDNHDYLTKDGLSRLDDMTNWLYSAGKPYIPLLRSYLQENTATHNLDPKV